MRDADMEAAMSVLATFLPTAYFWNPQLHHLVACQMMVLTLRHGLTSASAVGLTAYGFELVITHQQYARAASFARVALALVERHGFLADEAKVCVLVGVTLLPWVEPARSLYTFIERAVRAGRRAGDVFFVCLGLLHRCLLAQAAGDRLEEVERAARAAADFTRGVGNEPLLICVEIVQRFTQALRGRPPAVPHEKLEEAAFAERVSCNPLFVSFWYRFHRLELHLILGNRAAALAEARQLSGLIVSQRGQYSEAHAVFLVALALAAHGEEAPAEEQARLRVELDGHHAFLRNLAAFCPANFLAFEALVTAEVARLHGRTEEAGENYERALRAARASGFLQYAALAGELAARFYRSRGLHTIAEAYLEEAWRAWQEWGAEARLRQLEQLRPRLEERLSRVLPHHLYAEPAQLDARAMVHASQVISQEILLPRLLEKLLRSALEQAGAERGYLLTLEDGRPLVRVAAQLTESGIHVSVLGEPAAPGAELPGSLLTHVQRMRQPVLLDDASQPSPFSSDPYFASLRVHSVLCIPLVRQADLAGMLYLENNQLAGAFTSERILTLEVLAAQAAISLENARLYQAAQEAVRVRDDFLAIASHELKTPITAMKLKVQSIRRDMGTRAHEAHTEDRLAPLLKTFERHVSRLAYLADEMLEVSRLKAGALALALEELDLSRLVREQVDTLAERLKAADCPVELEFGEPVVGQWDRIRLGRLVTSLLLNAMKFGAGCPITVRTRVTGHFARLEVQDRGGGVDRADQARIFERFEQAAPAHHYGGLGLGLYLARETVRAHGGTISVESALGAGATFVVELPLRPPGTAGRGPAA
jgi:signal transduction histidine kinase/tetratricopeptide (TPR) repeat protein